jgi:hypothetical protein
VNITNIESGRVSWTAYIYEKLTSVSVSGWLLVVMVFYIAVLITLSQSIVFIRYTWSYYSGDSKDIVQSLSLDMNNVANEDFKQTISTCLSTLQKVNTGCTIDEKDFPMAQAHGLTISSYS